MHVMLHGRLAFYLSASPTGGRGGSFYTYDSESDDDDDDYDEDDSGKLCWCGICCGRPMPVICAAILCYELCARYCSW